eukprot:scaffold5208_cov148-Prasinococcus_capsulatus_cf.AAC.1
MHPAANRRGSNRRHWVESSSSSSTSSSLSPPAAAAASVPHLLERRGRGPVRVTTHPARGSASAPLVHPRASRWSRVPARRPDRCRW